LQIVTNGQWRFIFSTSSTSLPSAGKFNPFNPFNFPAGGKAGSDCFFSGEEGVKNVWF
jgi:hypothetical protein